MSNRTPGGGRNELATLQQWIEDQNVGGNELRWSQGSVSDSRSGRCFGLLSSPFSLKLNQWLKFEVSSFNHNSTEKLLSDLTENSLDEASSLGGFG